MKKFDFLISKVHNGILNQTLQTIVVNIKNPPFVLSTLSASSSTSRKEKEEVAETFLFLTSYREEKCTRRWKICLKRNFSLRGGGSGPLRGKNIVQLMIHSEI